MNNMSPSIHKLFSLCLLTLLSISLTANAGGVVWAHDEGSDIFSSKSNSLMMDVVLTEQIDHQSNPDVYHVMELNPVWTEGIISDQAGKSDVVVDDLNNDGFTEVAYCVQNIGSYLFAHKNINVFSLDSQGNYQQLWYSQRNDCEKITSADRNHDGIQELYVVTSTYKMLIVSGDTFQEIDSISFSFGSAVDIEVANVDNDDHLEIVLLFDNSTLIYDAETLELEWNASGYGGSHLAVGNIDTDSNLEIIVNGPTAYVLNADSKTMEWGYSGGFGVSMDVGDVDGDLIDEIVYVNENNVYVFEGDTLTVKWTKNDLGDAKIVIAADVDGSGRKEIVLGDIEQGEIIGLNGQTGDNLWSIVNPQPGVFGISVGDANNDNVNEIVWGVGLNTTGRDALFIGDWQNQNIIWTSDDLDGPFTVASGDLDIDGSDELVVVNKSADGGTKSGRIEVFDPENRQLEWSVWNTSEVIHYNNFLIGQFDGDPTKEILVIGTNNSDVNMYFFDGVSGLLEKKSDVLSGYWSDQPTLVSKNIDEEEGDEIFYCDNNNVWVYDGISMDLLWESKSSYGTIVDISLGDLDGNGVQDLAVLTTHQLFVYETDNWAQIHMQSFTHGAQLIIANNDMRGNGEILIIDETNSLHVKIVALSGLDYSTIWEQTLGKVNIMEMIVVDADQSGEQEIYLLGNDQSISVYESLFWVAAPDYRGFWLHKAGLGLWGSFKSMALMDTGSEGPKMVAFGSDTLFQVNKIESTRVNVYQAFMPMLIRDDYKGIFGKVTQNGTPAANVSLDLRFYNGATWTTKTTVQTDIDGRFFFKDIPPLETGQQYYVRYLNSSGASGRLWTWGTRTLNAYCFGCNVEIGDFDIADIYLTQPNNGDIVTLPYAFHWSARSATPTDIYEFDLFDPYDGDPYSYSPLLGYVNNFTLNSLPIGFKPNTYYAWTVFVYRPDGSYGVSYYSRWVSFSNTGKSVTELHDLPTKKLLPQLKDTPLIGDIRVEQD